MERHTAAARPEAQPPAFGWHCHGYSRWKLNEEQQAIVRKYWPADRPKYWTLADRKQLSDLSGEIVASTQTSVETKMMRDDGRTIAASSGMDWYEDLGTMRRDDVSRVGSSHPHLVKAISLYPADMSMSQDKWPELPDERGAAYAALKPITTVGIEVDGGKKRGFAHCYAMEWPRQFQRVVEAFRLWQLSMASRLRGRSIDGRALVPASPLSLNATNICFDTNNISRKHER